FRDEPAISETVAISGGTFSANLVPQIVALVGKQGFCAADLQAIVAVNGPGSFTSLRVGLTAAKGLAEGLHLPIVTVSALELLAAGGAEGEQVLAALDAGRNQAYVGHYIAGALPAC